MNCDKVLGSFGKIDVQELIYRYETTFKHLQDVKEEEVKIGEIS
jgi:hypothetical protein